MQNWSDHAVPILIALLLLWSLFRSRKKLVRPDPAALALIRSMSDGDQRHFQEMATTNGKIDAIKALRARYPVGLQVGKDAIELLQAVKPALLKFD